MAGGEGKVCPPALTAGERRGPFEEGRGCARLSSPLRSPGGRVPAGRGREGCAGACKTSASSPAPPPPPSATTGGCRRSGRRAQRRLQSAGRRWPGVRRSRQSASSTSIFLRPSPSRQEQRRGRVALSEGAGQGSGAPRSAPASRNFRPRKSGSPPERPDWRSPAIWGGLRGISRARPPLRSAGSRRVAKCGIQTRGGGGGGERRGGRARLPALHLSALPFSQARFQAGRRAGGRVRACVQSPGAPSAAAAAAGGSSALPASSREPRSGPGREGAPLHASVPATRPCAAPPGFPSPAKAAAGASGAREASRRLLRPWPARLLPAQLRPDQRRRRRRGAERGERGGRGCCRGAPTPSFRGGRGLCYAAGAQPGLCAAPPPAAAAVAAGPRAAPARPRQQSPSLRGGLALSARPAAGRGAAGAVRSSCCCCCSCGGGGDARGPAVGLLLLWHAQARATGAPSGGQAGRQAARTPRRSRGRGRGESGAEGGGERAEPQQQRLGSARLGRTRAGARQKEEPGPPARLGTEPGAGKGARGLTRAPRGARRTPGRPTQPYKSARQERSAAGGRGASHAALSGARARVAATQGRAGCLKASRGGGALRGSRRVPVGGAAPLTPSREVEAGAALARDLSRARPAARA